MENLDILSAEKAQQVIEETKKFDASAVENLATKALGVLQENGVYAATLFLYSRSGNDAKIAPLMRKPLLELAAEKVVHQPVPEDEAPNALSFVTKHIASDLDTLLLVKQVWEQALIYVRYGAKARSAEKDKSSKEQAT
jgi:hypothetical protein